MIINIFAFSNMGCNLAKEISDKYQTDGFYTSYKGCKIKGGMVISSISDKVLEIFNVSDMIIFIGAAGIAVRVIAQNLKNKAVDPGVIVVDEKAEYIIPILSGHIGGGNLFAKELSSFLNGKAVITTATDVNNLFSVDTWATENNAYIDNLKKAKYISSQILDGNVTIKSEFNIIGALPNRLVYTDNDPDILITYKNEAIRGLRLIPKTVIIGIGCRRNTPFETIDTAFKDMLNKNNIDINSVMMIATIDLKNDEQGILSLSEKYKIPLKFFTSQQLLMVKGEFTSSEMVRSVTGVGNVCERAAAAVFNDTKKLAEKAVYSSITFAAYLKNWEANLNG